jgi:hypothetical protein
MKMPVQAILPLFLGPSAIAIHDDGDVPGQPLFINSFQEAHDGVYRI